MSLTKASGAAATDRSGRSSRGSAAPRYLAVLALGIGRRTGSLGVAEGIAGGLLFSIGDISTKLVTQGGARFAFVVTLVIGYTLGTSLLRLGYRRERGTERPRPRDAVP